MSDVLSRWVVERPELSIRSLGAWLGLIVIAAS